MDTIFDSVCLCSRPAVQGVKKKHKSKPKVKPTIYLNQQIGHQSCYQIFYWGQYFLSKYIAPLLLKLWMT